MNAIFPQIETTSESRLKETERTLMVHYGLLNEIRNMVGYLIKCKDNKSPIFDKIGINPNLCNEVNAKQVPHQSFSKIETDSRYEEEPENEKVLLSTSINNVFSKEQVEDGKKEQIVETIDVSMNSVVSEISIPEVRKNKETVESKNVKPITFLNSFKTNRNTTIDKGNITLNTITGSNCLSKLLNYPKINTNRW